jgi:integrase
MDISIATAIEAVMKALVSAQYAPGTLLEYEKAFKRLIIFSEQEGKSQYTLELGARFASDTTGKRTGRECEYFRKKYGRCIRLIDSYVNTGTVNLGMIKKQKKRLPEAGTYRDILEGFIEDLASRGLADSTMRSYGNLACGYLIYLENEGCPVMAEVAPATIGGYLLDLRQRWQASAMWSAVISFRPFLRYIGNEALIYALDQVRTVRHRSVVSVLSESEQASLWEVLTSGLISARDRAIVLLGFLTGIRACDIIGLTFDDICWEDDSMTICQKKTGNALVLPLIPIVGNALYQYMKDERPRCEHKNVFVRSVAPFSALADHASIYSIIGKVLAQAGVQLESRLGGARLLRSNAATNLLAAGVRTETISAVLGHADPVSTDAYLSIDEKGMRECVLELKVRCI